MSKVLTKRLPILAIFLLVIIAFSEVGVCATLTPSVNVCTQGTYVKFELTGANADSTYSVYLNDEYQFDITTDSNGKATFYLSLYESGDNVIEVRNSTDNTVIASCTVKVKSLSSQILPIVLPLLFSLIVIFIVFTMFIRIGDIVSGVFRRR